MQDRPEIERLAQPAPAEAASTSKKYPSNQCIEITPVMLAWSML